MLGINACHNLGLVYFGRAAHKLCLVDGPTQQLLSQYKELFNDKLGKLPIKYHIAVDLKITPVVKMPHGVPYAMHDRIHTEVKRMVSTGVIAEVIDPSDWVSTMVIAIKKNKKEIRICINPRDLNTAIKRPHYPMRTTEEVAAQMGNEAVLVLDAKSSLWQIPLDPNSSNLTTFGTPFLRVPFGINSAREVFQRTMEQMFAEYPCAIVVDDILVYGRDLAEQNCF